LDDAEIIAWPQRLQGMTHEGFAGFHRLARHGTGGVEHEHHLAGGDIGGWCVLRRLDEQGEEAAALIAMGHNAGLSAFAAELVTQNEIAVVYGAALAQRGAFRALPAFDGQRVGGTRHRANGDTRRDIDADGDAVFLDGGGNGQPGDLGIWGRRSERPLSHGLLAGHIRAGHHGERRRAGGHVARPHHQRHNQLISAAAGTVCAHISA
jgi:hypothetical protein